MKAWILLAYAATAAAAADFAAAHSAITDAILSLEWRAAREGEACDERRAASEEAASGVAP